MGINDIDDEYILMCEKAKDVQDIFLMALKERPFYTDGKFHADELDNGLNFFPSVVYHKEYECMTIITETPDCSSKNQVITADIVEVLCEGNQEKSKRDAEKFKRYCKKIVWLPSQEQLQKIVYPDYCSSGNMNEIGMFYQWCCGDNRNYMDGFMDITSIWLAYVMDSYYEKKWDGKDWIQDIKKV